MCCPQNEEAKDNNIEGQPRTILRKHPGRMIQRNRLQLIGLTFVLTNCEETVQGFPAKTFLYSILGTAG